MKKKIYLFAPLVLMAWCAGCAPSQMSSKSSSPAASRRSGDEQRNLKKRIYHDKQFVVNLECPNLDKYLTVGITLAQDVEIGSSVNYRGNYKQKSQMADRNNAKIRNWIIIYLSDLDEAKTRGAKAKRKILADIKNGINDHLRLKGDERIQECFFTQFLIGHR